MESRSFIREAKVLIEDINAPVSNGSADEIAAHRKDLQRRISSLFSGLQNPTLPSAFNLRDAALANGFVVAPPVLQRLASFDTV